jgi:hypothetical protein
VSLLPDPPVLAANTTTRLEVCYRPLLVGSSEAKLLLESPELGQYEWGMRLTGAAGAPERSLGFSVPLGMRETQVRGQPILAQYLVTTGIWQIETPCNLHHVCFQMV